MRRQKKALQKYPNDFEIVYRSAGLYRVFGIVEGDEALLRRALALLDKARLLLPQNADPKINETVLYAETAQTLLSLGEADKAVSLWKTHNAGGFTAISSARRFRAAATGRRTRCRFCPTPC